ncbi:MAG: restriction endonuclease subunit S, partial [Fimbriimonadaceae bacterium]|nr:restriction endonuclease subunit S [Fimbriimonadaceae bacterium]
MGDVISINPGTRGRDWPHSHMCYIDISAVGEGLMTEEPATIPTHQAPSRAQRLVKDGDVILSTVRPNRRSMLYARNPSPNTVVSTGFAVLRARESDIDSRFLYALVQDRAFTDYLVTREQGAAYPAISTNDIFEAEVALPPLWEQRRIAQVLGSLDDKIELHRRMCATLEEMARAIFRSWFVDFDPVRAKVAAIAEGRDPERAAMAAISGKNEQALDTLPAETLASLRATASLFPSSFTDSELGEIPEGWHDGRLAELCTLNESSWNNRT